jgi:organic hydroperoxide reductase OsmC/OhrA
MNTAIAENGRGGGPFTGAILRPQVTAAEATMREVAERLRHPAAERCLVAAPVGFPVRCEVEVEVA